MANATAKHSAKIHDPNERKLVGKKVYYIGNTTCERCGHPRKRGMMSLYEDKLYCSEGCVLAVTVAS